MMTYSYETLLELQMVRGSIEPNAHRRKIICSTILAISWQKKFGSGSAK